jgi:hypothetical protein
MACPFCGTALTIPSDLRWKQAVTPEPPPSTVKPAFDPFKAAENARPSGNQPEKPKFDSEFVAKTLRQAQPLAAGAVSAYALWAGLRRILPACLTIAVSVLCAFLCGTGLLFFFLTRQGGG